MKTVGSERNSVNRPQGKKMLSSSLRFLFYNKYLLSPRGEDTSEGEHYIHPHPCPLPPAGEDDLNNSQGFK
jgi:hypothetical protein